MARKSATAQANKITSQQVLDAVHRGEFATATRLGKELCTAFPSEDSRTAYRKALAAAAANYADSDRYPEFVRTMTEAESLPSGGPGWTAELAILHARGGNAPKAKQLADSLNDPAIHTAILAHSVDRAVRFRSKSALPADLHPQFDAILRGFEEYQKGNDEAARTALEAIGFRSPFLDWKLLIRGLIAYTASDDSRAVENFQRLGPDRLPARLAAPIRLTIDPAFRATLPPPSLANLDAQASSFTSDALLSKLRDIRKDLGRDKPLASAFRHAEDVVPKLAKCAPHLVPQLANVFYQTIMHHGEPSDMQRYRRLFGSPKDDPWFHRLEGTILESARAIEEANSHWIAYESWLAGSPPGWPAPVLARARAIVLDRIGNNLLELDELGGASDDLEDFFGLPPRRKGKPQPVASPIPFLQKATELAPDWEEPALSLFDHLMSVGKHTDAESIARKHLEKNPKAIELAESLSVHLQSQGRAAEALALRKQILAANPLDKKNRMLVASSHLAAARREMIAGKLDRAQSLLDEGQAICDEEMPVFALALRSTIARKAGRKAEADDLASRATAFPGGRLVATYQLAVDGLLAKLKPAERKPLDAALAEALTGPASPMETGKMYGAWGMLLVEGVEYRGQKGHEKKILDLVSRTPQFDAPEEEFEKLTQALLPRMQWKALEKVATACRRKFPSNPVFPLMLAEVEFGKANGNPRPYKVTNLLDIAKSFAERSPHERHKPLLERISELDKFARPEDLLPFLFDRFR